MESERSLSPSQIAIMRKGHPLTDGKGSRFDGLIRFDTGTRLFFVGVEAMGHKLHAAGDTPEEAMSKLSHMIKQRLPEGSRQAAPANSPTT